jgi:transposase
VCQEAPSNVATDGSPSSASAAAAAAAAAEIPLEQMTHLVGFDWATKRHQVVVVDRQGSRTLELCFDDDAAGWALLRARLGPWMPAGVAVAIETCNGPAVERLLEMGLAVYPLNPKSAERYRDRKAPAGVKDDLLDAWSFADALRTDGHGWRRLAPLDPLTAELRMLCRDEMGLIAQRTAMINALRAALHEYYPAALEAFDDWTGRFAWEFVIAFPTPAALLAAGRCKWEKFLHLHKLWRPETAQKRLEIFARAAAFASPSTAVTAARSLLAVTLAKQLLVLQTQLDEYRRRIGQAFDNHPDAGLFGSLPGAAEKLAPRLLAELGADRAVFDSPQALQCYAGTAPVTRQSGQRRVVQVRFMCNRFLRHAVHLWANASREKSPWAQAYYQRKKDQGMGHAAALRALGQRWLKILWKMWQTRTPYDAELHQRNQVRHGSWVIALIPNPAA